MACWPYFCVETSDIGNETLCRCSGNLYNFWHRCLITSLLTSFTHWIPDIVHTERKESPRLLWYRKTGLCPKTSNLTFSNVNFVPPLNKHCKYMAKCLNLSQKRCQCSCHQNETMHRTVLFFDIYVHNSTNIPSNTLLTCGTSSTTRAQSW